MDRTTAKARLGLHGDLDAMAIARAYRDRRSQLLQQLLAVPDDLKRREQQVLLLELIEAFEILMQTGLYASATADSQITRSRDNRIATRAQRELLIKLERGTAISGRFEIGPMLGQGGMKSHGCMPLRIRTPRCLRA